MLQLYSLLNLAMPPAEYSLRDMLHIPNDSPKLNLISQAL